MGKMLQWQIKWTEKLKRMSNRELLNEIYLRCEPDDNDGDMTGRGQWMRDYSKRFLENCLFEWLKK